ncbi:MAG: hypothetical protein HOE11_02280 [Candidatus Diapherotrites archaeon]|jgi:hypothetical protein|nr:hypothetical protein [Candidatus Diapherotrites archaeon]MBT4596507.1 hypothetical protein [Candidatus Diapherotrites archaeon]
MKGKIKKIWFIPMFFLLVGIIIQLSFTFIFDILYLKIGTVLIGFGFLTSSLIYLKTGTALTPADSDLILQPVEVTKNKDRFSFWISTLFALLFGILLIYTGLVLMK